MSELDIDEVKKRVFDIEYPKITYTREDLAKQRIKTRGSIRVSTGRLYTEEEFEQRRKEAATPLP